MRSQDEEYIIGNEGDRHDETVVPAPSIVHLFEAQVAARPHATALVSGQTNFTYEQLNSQANQLAHYLLSCHLPAQALVPVCLERTPHLLITLLGILKAGAAYVPLDASYPTARLRYMLDDTDASLIISSRGTRAALLAAAPDLTLVEVDGSTADLISQQPTHNPLFDTSPRHLAYVIYTSGSTGQPKGVLVEHGNVVSLVHEVDYVALTPATVVLATGSPAFDATTFEYWGPLLNGGKLVLAGEQQLLNSALLAQEISQHQVTTMWFTSSWCNQLIDTAPEVFQGLTTVLVGGEKLSETHMQRLQLAYPTLEIINGYGPTENTTFSLTHQLTAADLAAGATIPLGTPLTGRRAYVLDEAQQPVAAGEEGEIYVAGAGVARGYLRQPALTQTRFGTDPFAAEPDARWYRTGDRGRWRPDGLLEYLGRLDEQVKLRGFRIEPGEIENVLNELEAVSNSCVVAKREGGVANRLVSYYVPDAQVVKAKERELYYRQVASWKELYETEYAKTEDAAAVDQEFNIIGWNDSFTGQPIPAAQMQLWLQDIVAVIMAEQPRQVLEIGCGTGLIYYQLAGNVEKYIGTDFSRSCINQITQTISQGRRNYGPTELMVGAAHELALREGEKVDTIILNSIIQYFPGEEYLTSVIEKSLSLLQDQGRLILGDVRDNRLLPLFKGRLQAPKLAETLSAKEFKWATEQEVLKEEELCFAPEYFYRLQARYPQITHVEIQWKQGSYINELTLYRYTVIMHVGASAEIMTPDWQRWPGLNKQEIDAQLQQKQPVVALQDVPNPRLRQERQLAQAWQDQSDRSLAAVLDAANPQDPESDAVEQLLQLAQEQGYQCRLFLDEDPLLMNVLLELEPDGRFIRPVYSENGYGNGPATNVSLFSDISSLLQKDLRTQLKQRLPEYMVPAEFIALSHLPLTNNGKVDRRFLSEREDRGTANKFSYEAPRNEAEQLLAGIWQELLGLEKVGIHDNFFELGGHSLLATRVVSAVRKALGVEVVIKDLFLHPTIAQLAGHLQAQTSGIALPALEQQLRPERIPLSFSQERLWFIDQLEGTVQYHVPVVLRLKGKLNRTALAAALFGILQRHEVLRTALLQQDGQAYQQVQPHADWQLTLIDGCVYQADPEAVQLQVQQIISAPFDLARDPMLRASLIGLAEQEHLLVITMHHIASDGWSLSILFQELVAAYRAHTEGRTVQPASLPVQYADFAIWQRRYLRDTLLEKHLGYWREKLNSVAQLQLPTDFARPAVQTTQGASVGFRLDKDLVEKLRGLSQQQGTTLFMTLLAGFKSLLYRYSGQEDICVGSAIANREQQEIEGLIGFFVNTLALRSQVRGNASFTDLLQQVKATTLEAYEHQQAPFEKVVDAVVKERNLSRSPVFQVMFVLQNTPDVPELSLGAVHATREGYQHSTAQFDFTFTLTEDPQGLQGFVEYSTDLYRAATITRLVEHFTELLQAIVKQPEQRIGALPMLTAAEQHTLLTEFGAGPAVAGTSENIVRLFEVQAAAQPQALAVVSGSVRLTYEQLNAQANQLAHYLRSQQLPASALVPVCLERTPQLLVALLGILKAGAAYVPLDPEYPLERLRYMLYDSGASVALTSRALSARLREGASAQLTLLELDGAQADIARQPATNLPPLSQPHDLAYVIYTSGSTGQPKGVMIEHHSAHTFLRWCRQEFAATPFDIVYAGTSVCFDLSIFEIFYPLSIGKPLRLLENGLEIGQYVAQDTNILINSVPSVINSLLKEGIDLRNVRAINMAGEPIPVQVQQRLDVEAIEVRNLYGPTEDTTYSTNYRLEKGVPALIGRPLGNTTVYVMSREGQLSPLGVAGEICLGGDGLARGYLNRPDLTAEKFSPNPFSAEPGARIYRTGDLGQWLPNGNLEYLGRLDDQVKVRGYRIELGEIETVLQKSALLKQAVVLAKADAEGTKRLVGYVVPAGPFNREAVVSYLRRHLPEYMVPVLWVELPVLPLTPNGKIDRKALPEPETSAIPGHAYVAPATDVEKALADIWQQVLGKQQIGVHSNFFELGGDSIITIQVISRAKQAGYSIQPKDLFMHQTIAQLAEVVTARLATTTNQEPGERHLSALGSKDRVMVPLRQEGKHPPFFAMPGFLLYRHLAAHLNPEQPFYGFELSADEDRTEVVKQFVQEMRQVQPHGPYYLGAYCGDYPTIFEVAHTLLEQGEEVATVVLFEAFPPAVYMSKKSMAYLKQKATIYYDELRAKTLKEVAKYVADEINIKLSFIYNRLKGNKKEADTIKNYPGKVVLFKASILTPGIVDDPLGGWSEHVTGDIEVLTVTGDHITIFKEPSVAELAHKLDGVLAKARHETAVTSLVAG